MQPLTEKGPERASDFGENYRLRRVVVLYLGMGTDTSARPIQPLARDGGRRALQVTLGALAVIPFASGLAGMLLGPRALPGSAGHLDATAESEYRFTSAFWFASAPIIWSAIPRIEQRTSLVRSVTAVVFAGGLARLVGWQRAGRPHAVFILAIALELVGLPAMMVWQSRIARIAGASVQ